jgi:thymidylate synthase (FAD)
MYWQIDLHNLFHFLKLRMDPHAQYEIRAYADVIFGIAGRVAPAACEAFEDYALESVRLSGPEARALRAALGLAADAEAIEDELSPPAALREAAEAEGITGKGLSRLVRKLTEGSHE